MSDWMFLAAFLIIALICVIDVKVNKDKINEDGKIIRKGK